MWTVPWWTIKKSKQHLEVQSVLLWLGDYGLDLFNTWALTNDQQKHLKESWWDSGEDHVKPQANHILNRYYLRGLKPNNRPLANLPTQPTKSQQTSVIHMVHLTCKVDTGAEVNVISKDYDRPGPNPQQRHLGPTQYRYTVKYRIRRLHYQHPWNLHCTSINMAISKIIYYILE